MRTNQSDKLEMGKNKRKDICIKSFGFFQSISLTPHIALVKPFSFLLNNSFSLSVKHYVLLPCGIADCDDISLFGNWHDIIGLFVGLAVSFLIRHSVDYVLRTCFSFVATSGRSSVCDSFFVT